VNFFESGFYDTDQLPDERLDSRMGPALGQVSLGLDSKREEEHISTGVETSAPVQTDSYQQDTLELSFACLLIPRFSDHYLSGDITFSLPVWMKEISVSYGWRLETLVIRPGYLQWVLCVPASINPSNVVRQTRQHTSLKILTEFPRYKQQILAGDFWAPGYAMIAGNQLLSPEAISNFIQVTRKHQGLY
jgi:REP element-mobilizing transposase RayT